MKMNIQRLHKNAIPPHYATDGSSCFDLFCHAKPEWTMEKGVWVTTIYTGWAFDIPHEYALMIFSRSGHGFKALTSLVNSVGIGDYDYKPFCQMNKELINARCENFEVLNSDIPYENIECLLCKHYHSAEVKVKLQTVASSYPKIKAGDAIAQAGLVHMPKVYFNEVEKLSAPISKHIGIGSTTA